MNIRILPIVVSLAFASHVLEAKETPALIDAYDKAVGSRDQKELAKLIAADAAVVQDNLTPNGVMEKKMSGTEFIKRLLEALPDDKQITVNRVFVRADEKNENLSVWNVTMAGKQVALKYVETVEIAERNGQKQIVRVTQKLALGY